MNPINTVFAVITAPFAVIVFALCWMFDDAKEPSYAK